MKTISISALTALVLAAPLATLAQTDYETSPAPRFDDRWYILPFATYTWADTTRLTDDNWGADWPLANR